MNKFLALSKIQFKEIFDFRSMFSRQNKSKNASFLVMLILFILLFGFLSFFYTASIASLLYEIGMIDLLPALMFSVASFVTLITTLLKVKGAIFGSKDYEILQSMPIKPSTIVLTKLLILYVFELLFTLIIMIPANLFYALFSNNFAYFIPACMIMLLIPIVPIIIASLIGFFISIISEKIKFKNIIQTILYLVFFFAIMALSFSINDAGMVGNIAESIADSANKVFPITPIYLKGCVEFDILYLFLYIGINIVAILLFAFIIGKNYKRINQLVLSSKAKYVYKEKQLKSKGQLMALFKKEIIRYFKTPIYVFNTTFGGLLLIIASVFLLIKRDVILGGNMASFYPLFCHFLPLAIYFTAGMTTTTAPSISLEGNNFWIIKSSPIDYNKYYMSKILVNEVILGPCVVISSLLCSIALKIPIHMAILTMISSLLYTVVTAYIGLIFNLIYPKMKWVTEQAAVKNSASVLLMMLSGYFLTGLLTIIFVVTMNASFDFLGICLATILILILIWACRMILKIHGARLIMRIEA